MLVPAVFSDLIKMYLWVCEIITVHLPESLRPPLEVRSQDDLGVALGTERVTLRLQDSPYVAIVEDLAIERDDHAATRALVHHRLMTQLAQIEDRKPSMPKADAVVGVEAFIIGAAMTQSVHHRLDDALIAPTE